MGKIVFWGIIRTGILLPMIWITSGYIETKYWWTLVTLSVYGVIIHPAILQYKIFREENLPVVEDTLCSSCKHFDVTAVLCMKYDEHPTENYLPCGGSDWEPGNGEKRRI